MTRRSLPFRAAGTGMLAVALWFALPVTPAVACTCAVAPASQHFDAASAVFAGVVIGVVPAGETHTVTFDVRTVYKGEVGATVDMRTSSSPDTCGIQFSDGASYLVFASGRPLATSLCSGTTDDLALLDREGYSSTDVALSDAEPAALNAPGEARRLPWIVAAALALAAAFGAHARRFARVMR